MNVAANRPTSSVGASSELYPASQAVEGSRQTAIEFCYSSAHVVAPWWAVDLGRSKLLETIVVTTFGTCVCVCLCVRACVRACVSMLMVIVVVVVCVRACVYVRAYERVSQRM